MHSLFQWLFFAALSPQRVYKDEDILKKHYKQNGRTCAAASTTMSAVKVALVVMLALTPMVLDASCIGCDLRGTLDCDDTGCSPENDRICGPNCTCVQRCSGRYECTSVTPD
uniref:Putative tick defensin n=1 Tax=Rhipicephalus pulchellus TaxID=72859 RepID=L7MC80_RHIPC